MNIQLAFSGGGFRAAFYALGAYRRLVELGVHEAVSHISSVSGGSLTAGAILCGLAEGTFADADDFDARVTRPLRRLGQINLRRRLLAASLVPRLRSWRFESLRRRLSRLLDEMLDGELYRGRLLCDLPSTPAWSCNATCLRTMRRFDFQDRAEGTRVSLAVAASNAFPLLFAPIALPSGQEEYLLTDGGVYDNLGAEPLFGAEAPYILLDASQDGLPWNPAYHNRRFGMNIRTQEITLMQLSELRRRLLNEHTKGVQLQLARPLGELRQLVEGEQAWEAVEPLIAGLRTDLDAFHNVEIDSLLWAGSARMDAAIKELRPEWIQDEHWQDVPKRPSYAPEHAREVLAKGQKNRAFRVHKTLS